MRKLMLMLLLPFLLVGCAGGTFANLIPLPKVLDGQLEDGTYTSPMGSFSVLTPFSADSYAFTYMEVDEGGKGNWENVRFRSSTAPTEIYRVETGIAGEGDTVRKAEEYLDEVGTGFKKRYETNGATDFEKVSSGSVMLETGEAVFSLHRYTAPSRFSLFNLSSSEPYAGWALIVVHASPKGVLYLSFDFSSECDPCERGDLDGVRELHPGIDRMLSSILVNWER